MRYNHIFVAAFGAITLSACDTTSSTSPTAVQLVSISPAAGSTGVSISSSIVLTFSRPMLLGMEALVVLHQGSVTGPVVPSTSSWSADRTTLTVTPSSPLEPRTTYVIHLAGNMRDGDGYRLDHRACEARGGVVVRGGTMGGPHVGTMMGPGWTAADGTYGMIFTFTTG